MTPDFDEWAPNRGSATTLLIDDHRVALRDDVDVHALTADLTKAVQADGAFVHVEATRGRSFDIMVTRSSNVMVVHRDLNFVRVEQDAPWDTGVDLEY